MLIKTQYARKYSVITFNINDIAIPGIPARNGDASDDGSIVCRVIRKPLPNIYKLQTSLGVVYQYYLTTELTLIANAGDNTT